MILTENPQVSTWLFFALVLGSYALPLSFIGKDSKKFLALFSYTFLFRLGAFALMMTNLPRAFHSTVLACMLIAIGLDTFMLIAKSSSVQKKLSA